MTCHHLASSLGSLFGYIFGETLVNKQNEKANDDMERQNKQKEDENRIEKQKYYFNKK